LLEEQGSNEPGGYHANNVYEDAQLSTAEAIANLATATASDRQAYADMMSANKMLLDQIIIKDCQISELTQQLATCRHNLASCQRNPTPQSSTKRRYRNHNYCWTHGYDVSHDHQADNCTRTDNGHKKEVTCTNNMGDSQVNKHCT
jgi:hypothetical protein